MKKKIVITDSGLGGLSVLGELENRLSEKPIFENAELIFFNSLYSSDYGYNSMKGIDEKSKVFNNALNSIVQNYTPDLILIACNTLSVVYPYTEFAQNPKVEVKGIVESGIALFRNDLNKKDKLILFGTPTTINSNVYKNELVKRGIDKTQIVNQACPNLETAIQNNPNGTGTREMIAEFVNQALQNVTNGFEKLFAGLCCTHYGYSEKFFYEELAKRFDCNVEILNPNNRMLDFLFANSAKTFQKNNVDVKIVSQVKLKNNEIKSLADILKEKSPKTSLALENYLFADKFFNRD